MKAINALTLTCMVALAALVSGCVIHEHVHSGRCGHYYSDGRWYYVPHHVHGPGCGHEFRGGIWVTIP